jgi:hypothetical protein
MNKTLLASLSALVLATGCVGAGSQIEVKGPDPDLVKLAGDWNGKFEGLDSGRTGTIHFALELGRHTADGQVLMAGARAPLAISFIKVDGATVHGQIQPYTDPNCRCRVRTQFEGQLFGDEIGGTFTTRAIASGREQHGAWNVRRQGG